MAGRIRSIKPELLEDSKAGQLSDSAWRLWVSSWLLADDHGNFRAHPAQLNGQVFWGSPKSAAKLRELLGELEAAGTVALYQVAGQEFASITGWAKHQRIDNAGKPRCPKPDEADQVRGESPRVSASLGELPPDHRPPTTEHRTTDLELAAKRGKRATVLPDGWVPGDGHRGLAVELGLGIEAELAKFRDHAAANARRQVDWDASFRTWLRNAVEFAGRRGGGQARASPKGLTAAEIWAQANDDEARERGGGG